MNNRSIIKKLIKIYKKFAHTARSTLLLITGLCLTNLLPAALPTNTIDSNTSEIVAYDKTPDINYHDNAASYPDQGLDFLDVLMNQESINLLETTHFDATRSASPASVLEVIVDLGVIDVLRCPLYLRTNPLKTISLLDMPIFWLPKVYCRDWAVGFDLFYDKTDRCNFTQNSDCINSYLAIQSQALLTSLKPLVTNVQKIVPGFMLDPIDALALFKGGAVQERRTGVMFHAERQWNRTTFSFLTPIYYLERNYWLTEDEQNAIADFFGSPASPELQSNLIKNHLVSDKVGLGDTRLYLDGHAYKGPHYSLRLGLQATLPTNVAFAQGLMGSTYKKVQCRPQLDLLELVNGVQGTIDQQEAAIAAGQLFADNALDDLSANLLEVPLGNYRHVGIGIVARNTTALCRFIHRAWAEQIYFRSKLSLEYETPGRQLRMYRPKSNAAEFAALNLNRPTADIINDAKNDPVYAQDTLDFLQTTLVNRLYPFAFNTKVCPGFIYHTETFMMYESLRQWTCYLGTDFYVQTPEKLKDIKINTAGYQLDDFDIKNAALTVTYQSKLIAAASYMIKRTGFDCLLAANAAQTFTNTGIGKSFSIAFTIETNF